MKIRIFKLVDGSEVIGRLKFSRNTSDIYVVEDALEIKYRVDLAGLATAVMSKYNYFGDENVITLNSTGVITHYSVSDKYRQIYEKSLDTALREPEETVTEATPKVSTPKIISGNNTVH